MADVDVGTNRLTGPIAIGATLVLTGEPGPVAGLLATHTEQSDRDLLDFVMT